MGKTHAAAHHKIQAIKRSAGRSAVAAAAYRHNARMTDERTGLAHDFTRKGDLVAEGVIGWTDTPETLWNAAEAAENRKNSITAREIVLALPHELDLATQEKLLNGHCLMMRDRYGVACSWVVHDPKTTPEPTTANHLMMTTANTTPGCKKNTHAHVMITSRQVGADGAFGKKTRILDDRTTGSKEFEHMREAWAKRANAALKKAGVEEMIDHRSLSRRAEAGDAPEQEPQRHLGPRLVAVARKHEKAAEQAKAQGKPVPLAPRFYREAKRIKRRNVAMLGLWSEANKATALVKAANTDGKIRDEGDHTAAEAIADTSALFEAAMESGVLAFKLADRRKKKELEKRRQEQALATPIHPDPRQNRPKGKGVLQLRPATQEKPQPAPEKPPQASAKTWTQPNPEQESIVILLRKGLTETEPTPKTAAPPKPQKQKDSLFGRVLAFFSGTQADPAHQADKPTKKPRPWQQVESPQEPLGPSQECPARVQRQTSAPEPKARRTDADKEAIIKQAAKTMLPREGEALRPPRPHRPPQPPALKPRAERTRSPPQR
ncbi:MobA/MobL family protein [Roseinatronobacter sp. S2]|uniref:MobA/MobL family protein n=1 Tax=Roseinatronobacter sp. S2 TaxID=3035471 RepID=UPI00240F0066|nr:MobA/MobL family protein [Roseinatronobacter sp. S2]WFE75905.1 MobA/MobL family protein [Roseinatronobacter sp. S2]